MYLAWKEGKQNTKLNRKNIYNDSHLKKQGNLNLTDHKEKAFWIDQEQDGHKRLTGNYGTGRNQWTYAVLK
jgi:hypothetical protein